MTSGQCLLTIYRRCLGPSRCVRRFHQLVPRRTWVHRLLKMYTSGKLGYANVKERDCQSAYLIRGAFERPGSDSKPPSRYPEISKFNSKILKGERAREQLEHHLSCSCLCSTCTTHLIIPPPTTHPPPTKPSPFHSLTILSRSPQPYFFPARVHTKVRSM
jgi:hypothetical protein